MTHLNYIKIAIALFSLTAFSCVRNNRDGIGKTFWADTTYLSDEEKFQRQVWIDFRKAVTSMDIKAFKQMTMSCIYCPDCYSYLPNKHSDTSDAKEYVLTETFVNNGGFQSVFNKRANEFYFNEANIGWILTSNASEINSDNCSWLSTTGRKTLEVSINDSKCSGDECSQTIFTFIDTEKGYKFYSMIHLP